jgi:sulfur-oxidizing protein SoxB
MPSIKKQILMITLFISTSLASQVTLNFIHIGDLHGHLVPRDHVTVGDAQIKQGGLAYIYTVIEEIRKEDNESILINTGDTVQGGVETLYTRGDAMINVLNHFGIDYGALGNWDHLYGEARTAEIFFAQNKLANWTSLTSNVYDKKTGKTVSKPYEIFTRKGIKVGIIGFTSERPAMAVGPSGFDEVTFTNGDKEFASHVKTLRPKVDLLVVISELGLAKNIKLAQEIEGVDFIFSSDMHEITTQEVILANGTVVVEEGQDGTRLGHMKVFMKDNKFIGHEFKMHTIDASIVPNAKIQALIQKERKPFLLDQTAQSYKSQFSKKALRGDIAKTIGETEIDLHRSNFSDNKGMNAVIEGSSHNFIAEVFRVASGADLGGVRGVRYGTHIQKGEIQREDMFHYIPISPWVGVGKIYGDKILKYLDKVAYGSLGTDPSEWTGGWNHTISGLKYSLNPNGKKGKLISEVQILEEGKYVAFDPAKVYTMAGYTYNEELNKVNKIPMDDVHLIRDKDNQPLEAYEIIENYLLKHKANPELNRIKLTEPLAKPTHKNREIQPLH